MFHVTGYFSVREKKCKHGRSELAFSESKAWSPDKSDVIQYASKSETVEVAHKTDV